MNDSLYMKFLLGCLALVWNFLWLGLVFPTAVSGTTFSIMMAVVAFMFVYVPVNVIIVMLFNEIGD